MAKTWLPATPAGQPKSARIGVLLMVWAGLVLAPGCEVMPTYRTSTRISHLKSIEPEARILLMPPDIKYYLVTAGGLLEPRAEWTYAARDNFVTAVDSYTAQRGARLVVLSPEQPLGDIEAEFVHLHKSVSRSILKHHFGTQLPSKGKRLDWSLGSEVRAIGEKHQADYALFSRYRGYHPSAGRVAMAFLHWILTEEEDPLAGKKVGFASLVDLRTGDIVWFNTLDIGVADLRSPKGAKKAVRELLYALPGN